MTRSDPEWRQETRRTGVEGGHFEVPSRPDGERPDEVSTAIKAGPLMNAQHVRGDLATLAAGVAADSSGVARRIHGGEQ